MVKVEREIVIHTSLDRVWDLISTQEGMRQWFNSGIEIDMRVGGKHRHVTEGVVISGEVLELIPHKKLVISWFEEGSSWANPLRVTFTLEESPDGTIVKHVKEGFEHIGKPTWERTYQSYQRGTDMHNLLGHLKAASERQYAV
jgi:uncharacterized protein YndB with AHSA1/START domain